MNPLDTLRVAIEAAISAATLLANVSRSRELSLVVTKLEEALMWCHKVAP